MSSLRRTRRADLGSPFDVLVLAVADGRTVAADLAAAPVIGWFRALAQWAQAGRTLDGGVVPRLRDDQLVEVCGLLALGDIEDADASAALAGTVLRWAMQARLLRLYGGVLRTVKNAAEWCTEPSVLWFRALNALARPDMALIDLLREYTGAFMYGNLPRILGDFLEHCAPSGPLDGRPGPASRLADVEAVAWLATSLGLVTPVARPEGEDSWNVTGLGRVVDALARLPFGVAPGRHGDATDESLRRIAQPEGGAGPGFVVKVALQVQRPVWRRLHVPGELTVDGLHWAIQTAFGWDGDHLHKFTAGPYRLAASWTGLEAAIPSDLVTVTDLAAIGVRELGYEYDLGAGWKHTIVIETALPPGSVKRLDCVGGAGTTPPEDGEGWREDEDGEYRPDPDYLPPVERAFDCDRISLALAGLLQV